MLLSRPRLLLIICAVTSLIVLAKFSSDSLVSNTTIITTIPPSNENTVLEKETLSPSSAVTPKRKNQKKVIPAPTSNIIFSTFYFSHGFYTGRKIPSLDWIIVMIESAYEHRHCASCEYFQDTKLVFFADLKTKKILEELITKRSEEKKRPNFLSGTSSFLQIVVVDPSTDEEARHLFQNERWADSYQLKNAANNFRFWLMQRYLKQFLSIDTHHHQNPQLARIKIAIVDASDVLFQSNPFEDGICFPSTRKQRGIPDRKQKSNQLSDVDAASSNYFLFTLEDGSKHFKNEIYNKRWMKCYDDVPSLSSSTTILAQMAKRYMRISCAGVSLGSYYGVLAYLQGQLTEISRPELTECAISKVKAALDQATHNFLMLVGVWWENENDDGRSTSLPFGKNNPWIRAMMTTNDDDGSEKRKMMTSSAVTVAAIPHHQHRGKSERTKMSKWQYSRRISPEKGEQEEEEESLRSIEEKHFPLWSDENTDCVFHGNFAKLKMNEKNEVVFGGGSGGVAKYAIVHQYTSDRHPRVMKAAKEKYRI